MILIKSPGDRREQQGQQSGETTTVQTNPYQQAPSAPPDHPVVIIQHDHQAGTYGHPQFTPFPPGLFMGGLETAWRMHPPGASPYGDPSLQSFMGGTQVAPQQYRGTTDYYNCHPSLHQSMGELQIAAHGTSTFDNGSPFAGPSFAGPHEAPHPHSQKTFTNGGQQHEDPVYGPGVPYSQESPYLSLEGASMSGRPRRQPSPLVPPFYPSGHLANQPMAEMLTLDGSQSLPNLALNRRGLPLLLDEPQPTDFPRREVTPPEEGQRRTRLQAHPRGLNEDAEETGGSSVQPSDEIAEDAFSRVLAEQTESRRRHDETKSAPGFRREDEDEE